MNWEMGKSIKKTQFFIVVGALWIFSVEERRLNPFFIYEYSKTGVLSVRLLQKWPVMDGIQIDPNWFVLDSCSSEDFFSPQMGVGVEQGFSILF